MPVLRVSERLWQMSVYLQQTPQFTLDAEFYEEDVLDSGQKLQFAGRIELLLRRPDKIRLDQEWARGKRRFWYDGVNLTLHDRAR